MQQPFGGGGFTAGGNLYGPPQPYISAGGYISWPLGTVTTPIVTLQPGSGVSYGPPNVSPSTPDQSPPPLGGDQPVAWGPGPYGPWTPMSNYPWGPDGTPIVYSPPTTYPISIPPWRRPGHIFGPGPFVPPWKRPGTLFGPGPYVLPWNRPGARYGPDPYSLPYYNQRH
jgi:hypothetical protein